MPRNSAFSLVELLMVLAIVMTVAAVAVPRYANALARYRAESTQRRIALDLQHAAAHAKAVSASVTVRFNAGDESITVLGPNSTTLTQTLLTREPYRADLTETTLADGEVIFDGFGFADRSGKVAVVCGTESRTVEIDHTVNTIATP